MGRMSSNGRTAVPKGISDFSNLSVLKFILWAEEDWLSTTNRTPKGISNFHTLSEGIIFERAEVLGLPANVNSLDTNLSSLNFISGLGVGWGIRPACTGKREFDSPQVHHSLLA